MRIVVLHSFWRASSTYFWARLRSLTGVCAFYEPFHEVLTADCKSFPTNGSLDGVLRHPPVQSYWHEYANLGLSPGDLFTQLDGSFQRGDYYDLTPKKILYLERLLHSCENLGVDTVVLGCVRSIAWASELKAWLSNRYPSAIQSHIYLKRDGYQQFQSGLRQFIEHNNPYFLAAHVEPMLAVRPRLAAACGFDTNWIHCQSDLSPTAAITSWSSHLPHPRISFARAYVANTQLCLSRGQHAMDHCFDLDVIAGSNQERSKAAETLSRACGLEVCLDDFHLESHGEFFDGFLYNELEEEMQPLSLKAAYCDLPETMSAQLASGVDLLLGQLSALQLEHKKILKELEESERYNRELENRLAPVEVFRTIFFQFRRVIRAVKRILVFVRDFRSKKIL